MTEKTGLYLHIPFCSAICHYCDFNKTALFDDAGTKAFFARLLEDLCTTAEFYPKSFATLFFGGGTPGLFSRELIPVLEKTSTMLKSGAEVTLEANPENVTDENCQIWRDHGVNRLSIGVQTFAPQGLKFLKRDHNADKARQAIATAQKYFRSVNIDLIYGRPEQDLASWQEDLREAVALGTTHLSLYTLTYEPRTPIGRAHTRGALQGLNDDHVAEMYEAACDILAGHDYHHEEVSNWSKDGYSCAHNWLYWQEDSYVGLGPGAHGYLAAADTIGTRYSVTPNWRNYILPAPQQKSHAEQDSFINAVRGNIESGRDIDGWILEIVGSGLRTIRGVDLNRLQKISGTLFQPTAALQAGVTGGQIQIKNHRLTLKPGEWFRENYWAIEVAQSLG